MIPVWAIGVIAAILLVGTVVPGVHLWWPTHQDPIRRSDLGLALMTGALIAFAVLIVQVLVDVRTRQDDRHRQAAAAKQSAEAEKQSLQISLETNDLSGINLKQAKLADFYLRHGLQRTSTAPFSQEPCSHAPALLGRIWTGHSCPRRT